MKEIVAAKIADVITTDRRHMLSAVEMDIPVQWLERKHMQMMAACDFGPAWENLAKAPTIFCIDDKGMPCAPPK